MTNSLAVFDYGALDVETRVVVQQKTGEIHERIDSIKRDFIEIGKRLTDVKARLPYGYWGAWLESEFGWSQDTATNLMNAAHLAGKIPNFSESGSQFAQTAMYVLGAKATPPAALDEAVERANHGERITGEIAKQIVSSHKSPVVVGRSGVNFAGEGGEPDLDEDGQPLVRRDSLTPLDVPPGTWVRWHGKRFVVKGYNGGSGNLWLMDERGKRSWVPLREVTRIDDEATEERIAERIDDDEEDAFLRLGDVVTYRGHTCAITAVASSGRLSLRSEYNGTIAHGIDADDVMLLARAADRQPPKAAPAAPVADLREGDRVITRTGHEGVVTVADVGRHVVVETVNGRTIHERSTLTKVAPVTTAPPLAEEIVQIDNVPVAETHPAGFKIFYGGSGWATCVNCGESHPRWSPVRGGDWRCDKPNCKRLTHDDLMIEYTKADADAEQRQERRESAQRSAFRSAGQTPRQNGQAVHYSSESPEWYTPPEIAALVREVMPINLDPASCYAAQQVIHADAYFDAQMNGLHPMRRWDGRVFLNPPYGREIGKWVERLISEYKAAHTIEAILLTPARPDTEWFGLLRDYPRCFVTGRLKFWTGETPDDQQEAAPFPSALFYLGNRFEAFAEAFSPIGDIYTLWRPT